MGGGSSMHSAIAAAAQEVPQPASSSLHGWSCCCGQTGHHALP
jgi:hypothetical protein